MEPKFPSLEEFCCLVGRYSLIFYQMPTSPTRKMGLQPEFTTFMSSHKDVFSKAVWDAVDEIRDTVRGAMFGHAIMDGIAHMIELYLERPIEEPHLSLTVLAMYMEITKPDLWPEMERILEETSRPEMERILGKIIWRLGVIWTDRDLFREAEE